MKVRAKISLMYILFLMIFAGANQSILAQDSESLINLLVPASDKDQAKLSTTHIAKVKQIKQAGTFKQVQIVKVGSLTKIQKKGILRFTLPDSSDSITFVAREVKTMSELDFTWIGASANQLSTAIFICKHGKLSGTFSINEGPFQLFYPNRRSFQLYPLGEGLSVLLEDYTNLPANCDVK